MPLKRILDLGAPDKRVIIGYLRTAPSREYNVAVLPLSRRKSAQILVGINSETHKNTFVVPSTLHTQNDISEKQWSIHIHKGKVFLEDFGTISGTILNGGKQKIHSKSSGKIELKHGDVAGTRHGMLQAVLDTEGTLYKKISAKENFYDYVSRRHNWPVEE